MKVLISGYGSIGRRHAELLMSETTVGVFDVSEIGREKAKIDGVPAVFCTPERAKLWQPDMVILATPTYLHAEGCRTFLDLELPMLIEKPIAGTAADLEFFARLSFKQKKRIKIMANMRCHPGPATIFENLYRIGVVRSVHAHCGSYLPTMRPGVDYRAIYASQRSQGGGVLLDSIHELDYLWWLFGEPTVLGGHLARLSDLEMDVEDHSVTVLDHSSGVRTVIELDYLQQHKLRGCRITGDEGTLVWQSRFKAPEIVDVMLYRADQREPEVLYTNSEYDMNAAYQKYLTHFLIFVQTGQASLLLDVASGAREVSLLLQIINSEQVKTGRSHYES